MDWTQQVIAYCERTDFSYWSEPVNTVTNAAFLIAAAVMAYRLRGARLPLAWALVAILSAIGLGSYLWHTHATGWSGALDVLPILMFILTYIYAATRDYVDLSPLKSGAAVVLFFPYAIGFGWLASQVVSGLGANGAYLSVAFLIFLYGLYLRMRLPDVARGLFIGAGILVASIGFRMADDAVCDVFPIGTHFMWHVLNGIMLGWMIEVYRRHMTARAA